LERVGSLEANEEAKVGKFFRVWLERGLEVEMARGMVDLFFADLALANSTHRWSRFVANAESLRQRVINRERTSGGRALRADDAKPFDWVNSLPPAMRAAAMAGKDYVA
jgi:hypothetical protein